MTITVTMTEEQRVALLQHLGTYVEEHTDLGWDPPYTGDQAIPGIIDALRDAGRTPAERCAYDLGVEDGRAAATWIIDGNTPVPLATLTSVMAGINDGDPAVLDQLPAADLSGQWADGRTPNSLAEECGLDYDEDDPSRSDADQQALCDAYEEGFDAGRDAEIARMFAIYSERT